MPDGAPRKPNEEDRFARRVPDHDTTDEQEQDQEGYPLNHQRSSEEPDVLVDVPVVKVDEIDLEVADLRARLSLDAEVLDLLRLHVGADVTLGRVALKIKGVEAQALLKVRLDNVAAIIERVLMTIDRNPQILEHVTRELGAAVEQVGRGAGEAVGEIGRGAGEAVEEVGRGAVEAVEDIGEAGRRDVAEGVGGRARSATKRATAEAPRRPGPEVQAARRAPQRASQTDQTEESLHRRAPESQPQRLRSGERARPPKQRPRQDKRRRERPD